MTGISPPLFGDVRVEVAWNAGYATNALDRVWTDVSEWVDLDGGGAIEIGYGRADERSTADANSLTVRFDNSDGRFTAGLATGAYHPNVKLGRPIRVLVTPPGSVTAVVRFTGYVDEWPLEWSEVGDHAWATVTARSRLARLGLNTAARSVVEEEFLRDRPSMYYPMGEAEGATRASDTSGGIVEPLTQVGSGAAVTWGVATGPGTDGMAACTLAGGKWLRAALPSGPLSSTVDPVIEMFFLASAPPASDQVLADLSNQMALVLRSDGKLRGYSYDDSFYVETATSVADGATHHVAFRRSSGSFLHHLYVDGVAIGSTGPTVGFRVPSTGALHVGGSAEGRLGGAFAGVVAHVAAYTTHSISAAPSASRITVHYQAGFTGFTGEDTGVRLKRYGRWAGIAAEEMYAEAGSTVTIAHVETTGQQILDLLQLVARTEGGVLFDDRSGMLTMHDRSHRYDRAVALTLDMAAHQVEADYAQSTDRHGLFNDAKVTNTLGTVDAHFRNQASADEYGEAKDSWETASDDLEEPFQAAAWVVNTSSEPTPRAPSFTVDVVNCGIDQATLLAVDLGDLVSVVNQPSQAADSSVSYFVEGYTESIGATSHTITINASPAAPYLTTLKLDDATRGALGANRTAY